MEASKVPELPGAPHCTPSSVSLGRAQGAMALEAPSPWERELWPHAPLAQGECRIAPKGSVAGQRVLLPATQSINAFGDHQLGTRFSTRDKGLNKGHPLTFGVCREQTVTSQGTVQTEAGRDMGAVDRRSSGLSPWQNHWAGLERFLSAQGQCRQLSWAHDTELRPLPGGSSWRH